jgi:ABC-2 type transport system ATP-binding protein
MTAIEVRDLCKTYPGGVEAVKGISFDVQAGEVFGLLGPNGAGKSTTVGMLTTTVAPSGGSARLAGHDVATQPLAARRVSSVVFQESVLDGGLSGRENVQLHARLWGVQPAAEAARIEQLVDAFGLGELVDRKVDTYSGGQRRRLEIARALVSRPQVLFLDEPTVGLDPRIRHELLDLIVGLRAREGVTILITTHYLDEALALTDRVAIVHRGEIVAMDRPEALLTSLGEEVLQFRVQGSAQAAAHALTEQGIAASDAFAVGATVTLPLHGHTAVEALAAVEAAGARTAEVQVRAPTLDDVYIRLTGAPFGESE